MPAQRVASTVDLITTCRNSGFVQQADEADGRLRRPQLIGSTLGLWFLPYILSLSPLPQEFLAISREVPYSTY